ncbi:cellulose 1,4-beta-cellobiosidase [Sphingomonas sp. PP-CE-3G-477]|uniref:glycoside hydrolase family 9 protein n=1 Tax=Sphingomonas sp. PP-CE-3G-477 TaxID=2135660 RepID=UPI000D34BC80|nr:glycoside hydrolase family 9 protein [Sphingomonas sp. PP-CE-3G-477]PTQ64679.1 cellulose 1,4-beta-cellobiosidase [Sphingomonas sp. PP-CE-3G-477]
MRRLIPVLLGAAAVLLTTAATQPPPAPIRIDQAGFETSGPKIAVLPSSQAKPLAWTLVDASGKTVASGQTIPVGPDAASGESVHRIDFATFRTPGTGYRLHVGATASHAFAIADRPFAPVATAAMAFFYQQRSGVPIVPAFVERKDLGRPAGHAPDIATCFAGRDQKGVKWPGCSYELDATGGWYDAGDQGKYVVNGGVSTWTLLDLYERLAGFGDANAFADGRLALPERANGKDDLLDEARVEVAFLLAMQIPDGTTLAIAPDAGVAGKAITRFETIDASGLVHTKIADENWTGIPTAPADDHQTRFLYPPSTAATLNMVGVAAQCARIWRTIEPAFATRCLTAARRGWAAALRHPNLLTSSDFTGSGGYGDPDVRDEFTFAAAQLYVTTGEPAFLDRVRRAGLLVDPGTSIDWGSLRLPAALTLATVPSPLPAADRARLQASITALADGFVEDGKRCGYGIPFAGINYPWGSNSAVLNRAIILGVAWQIDQKPAYRDAVVASLDYILGRNPLDRSYVTGFGTRPMQHPHHRFWAAAADQRYPAPPSGVLSGGPNSDEARNPGPMQGCAPQTCWIDDYRAFTVNEVTINWNAPLVWTAAFLDATRAR